MYKGQQVYMDITTVVMEIVHTLRGYVQAKRHIMYCTVSNGYNII